MSETENLPAAAEPSAAEKQRARMEALVKAVEGRSASLTTLLGQSGISFERFVEVFRRALIKGQEKPQTNLLLADAGSVIQACIDACTAGLLPDGKQGAIVIYNTNVAPRGAQKQWVKRAQFIAMYEGMLKIAYDSGNFQSIMAHVVYDGDDFDYELGIDPWIKHRPAPRPARTEGAPEYQMVAAYAVAKTINEGVFVEVFEPEDIRKVMAVSRATSGPAKDWPEQMARKGPLRRMWKFLPRNERMDRVLEVDAEANLDDLDIPEPAAPRKLRTGFARPPQQALTQGADPVAPDMDAELEGDYVPAFEDPAPSNPAAKSYEATAPDHEEPSPGPTALEELFPKLQASASWLNVKQTLRTFRKDERPKAPTHDADACRMAWERMQELRQGGGDKTDFASDPLYFEVWLVGSEPDPDTVNVNWDIVRADRAFEKLDAADRERITRRVDAVLTADDGRE